MPHQLPSNPTRFDPDDSELIRPLEDSAPETDDDFDELTETIRVRSDDSPPPELDFHHTSFAVLSDAPWGDWD